MLIFVACQREKPPPLFIPNDVDLNPLINLTWPAHVDNISDLVDTTKLDHQRFVLEEAERDIYLRYTYKADRVYLVITMWAFKDEIDAISTFHHDCDLLGKGIYLSGSGVTNQVKYQYCIPYLDVQRGGPEVGFVAGNSYICWGLALQKGNVAISIDEFTETLDRKPINEAIRQLADAMTMKSTSP